MEQKKSELIAQSNALTSSRYDFSPTEKNVLYHVIKKVRQDYIEGTMQRDLWDNMYVTIDSADLARIADEDHTKRARQALRNLRHRDVEIEDEEGNWFTCGFINYAKYDAKSRTYEVEVSKMIMPHLVELARNFTSYSLTVAISLKSKYSQRFYEWAHQYLGREVQTFFLDITDLRQMLKLENRYEQKQDFKRFVIDVAVKELKELYERQACDLWLEYYDQGRGDATRFYFKIHTKDGDKQQEMVMADLKQKMIYIFKANEHIFRKDPKYRQRIISAMEMNPNIVTPMFDKLTKIERDTKASSLPALWRYILREDYNIE